MTSLREQAEELFDEKERIIPKGDPRIEALRLALETTTVRHPGTPWEHPERASPKKDNEPELV